MARGRDMAMEVAVLVFGSARHVLDFTGTITELPSQSQPPTFQHHGCSSRADRSIVSIWKCRFSTLRDPDFKFRSDGARFTSLVRCGHLHLLGDSQGPTDCCDSRLGIPMWFLKCTKYDQGNVFEVTGGTQRLWEVHVSVSKWRVQTYSASSRENAKWCY